MKQNQTVRHVKQRTPEHYLLHCTKYGKEREVLFKTINKIFRKNSQYIVTLIMEDVLEEQNFTHDDHKFLREVFEKYINCTKKDF